MARSGTRGSSADGSGTAHAFVAPRAILHQAAEPDPGDFVHIHDRLALRCALALLALVDPAAPGRRVEAKFSDVLRIVDGEPDDSFGRFPGKRFRDVTKALVQLFTRKFTISKQRRRGRRTDHTATRSEIYFLDDLAILYADGSTGTKNVGTDTRPVNTTPAGRPVGFAFRLSAALAGELTSRRGVTVSEQLHAQLRQLRRDASAIRFALWLARQRDTVIQRNTTWLATHFVGAAKHMGRAESAARVNALLEKVLAVGLLSAVATQTYQPGSKREGEFWVLHRRAASAPAAGGDPGAGDGQITYPGGRNYVPWGEKLRSLGGEPSAQPAETKQVHDGAGLYDFYKKSIHTNGTSFHARSCVGECLRRPHPLRQIHTNPLISTAMPVTPVLSVCAGIESATPWFASSKRRRRRPSGTT